MLYTPAAKKDKKQEDLKGLAEANNTPEIGKDKSTVKKLFFILEPNNFIINILELISWLIYKLTHMLESNK